MNPRTASIINQTVRETVLTTHAADSCIASVSVLKEVLRIGFNIPLHHRAVTATLYNPHISKQIIDGTIQTTDELVAQVRSERGWSVGIGFGAQAATDANKWAGHLVGITKHPNGLLLWDPSLDQAARPLKNMNIKPLVTRIEQDLYETPETCLTANDCYLVYTPKERGESILEVSPDWKWTTRFQWHVQHSLEVLAAKGIPMGGTRER